MPAPGKPFGLFVVENRQCRAFAEQSIGTARRSAAQSMINSAAVGTTVGALGGGHNGAATGAAFSRVAGTASCASQADYSGAETQLRYDITYQQCSTPRATSYLTAAIGRPHPAPSCCYPPPR